MALRTKEEMKGYQKERRLKLKGKGNLLCPECAAKDLRIANLEAEINQLKEAPVPPPEKKEIKKPAIYDRPSHHSLTCKCLMCKPPL